MSVVEIQIAETFRPYLDAAITRFSYLFPSTDVDPAGNAVRLTDPKQPPNELKQEFLHILYREKVYAETLELRQSLYQEFGRW